MNALIGATGFVGTSLARQCDFTHRYHSPNIADIAGPAFDTVMCAAAPAQKWIANRDPAADLQNIRALIEHLKAVRCRTFILVSTVDVFRHPVGVDESTPVDQVGLHAYGLHRRLLEEFVADRFAEHLIVRLPGLVGPGLRKNVLFDLLNDNNLAAIDSRGRFQFYPMVNLWPDIRCSLDAGLRLVHLTAAPLSVATVAKVAFNRQFEQHLAARPAEYDFRTRHAAVFGVQGPYQYSVRESVQAIRCYAQSEPKAARGALR